MSTVVPTYDLYGVKSGLKPEFWLHCETLMSRSSIYRWEIGIHRHDSFFQILHIQDGQGDATLDGTVHSIRPPAVIVVPPGFPHGFRFSKDIQGVIVTVLASHLPVSPTSGGRLGEWLSKPRLIPLPANDPDADYLDATLGRIGEEFEVRRAGRDGMIEACLATALTLIARFSMRGEEGGRLDPGGSRCRIEQLDDLINRHFRSHRPASFYAAQLGISTTHLNRIVKTATGLTTQQLIARKLLDAARRDLIFTPGTVQEIGLSLGFTDPAYFSRFFLRQLGLTPRAFRRMERA